LKLLDKDYLQTDFILSGNITEEDNTIKITIELLERRDKNLIDGSKRIPSLIKRKSYDGSWKKEQVTPWLDDLSNEVDCFSLKGRFRRYISIERPQLSNLQEPERTELENAFTQLHLFYNKSSELNRLAFFDETELEWEIKNKVKLLPPKVIITQSLSEIASDADAKELVVKLTMADIERDKVKKELRKKITDYLKQ
jgi:hypothetical protein